MVYRPIRVGGGPAHVQLITDDITGLVINVIVKMNRSGRARVESSSGGSIVDSDLDAGNHQMGVPIAKRWNPNSGGLLVELTVRWP